MNMKTLKFRFLLFLLSTLLFLNPVLTATASTQFTFFPTKSIQTAIAYGQVNRIQVTNGEIMEVVGDENQYQIYWSGDYRNLFIAPKVEIGKTIELSLVLAGGETQDIRFTVVKTAAQTIFINKGKYVTTLSQELDYTYSIRTEISAMIRAMTAYKDMNGKYYIIDFKRIVSKNKQMTITQEVAYRYQDLNGAVLVVQNNSNKALHLNKQDFKDIFKDSVAISIETNSLKPKAKGRVFVITRGNNEQ